MTHCLRTAGALAAAIVTGISVGACHQNLGMPIAAPASTNPGWNLVWSDEFDGTSLDTSNWTYDIGNQGGWGNNELEYYRPDNAVVANGYLTITAKKESYGGSSYTSARIQTSRKRSFTYGKFEMRAKLPSGQGIWPAFWLLGANSNAWGLYGGTTSWPGCGEIDAMEMVGGGAGDYTVHGTLHYLNSAGQNPMPSYSDALSSQLSDGFHVYAVVWTPQGISFSVDGTTYGFKTMTSDMEEFSKPFFILLNLAVGGNWPGYPDATTSFPQQFVVDYVRVYSLPASY